MIFKNKTKKVKTFEIIAAGITIFLLASIIAIPTSEAGVNPTTTLKITKLTTGGGDTFDFTVTGPTSYNPSINTAGDSGLMTIIDTTAFFNNDAEFVISGPNDIEYGQLMTFSPAQSISQITLTHANTEEFIGTDTGQWYAVIYSGISDGSSSFTVLGTSNIFQAPWNDDGFGGTFVGNDDHSILFTFSPPVTVSGSNIFVGFVLDKNTPIDFTIKTSTIDLGGNEGVCISRDFTVDNQFHIVGSGSSICSGLLTADILMKIEGVGGMGMDGPTPVEPGIYSIKETIPAGWNLTTATCNDGSSSFNVDTVSAIVIALGDNIECIFMNNFSPFSEPSQVTGLSATATGTTTIDLAWTTPVDDGGSPITGYKIQRESPIGSGFITIVTDTGTPASTFGDTGLTFATQYNYRVSAINAIGTGPASNEAAATTFTPQEAADDLIDDIDDLINDGTLTGGQSNALISKVQNIIDKLNNSKTTSACNQLDAFINQVNAYVNGGTLTAAEGQALIDAAQTIKDATGC